MADSASVCDQDAPNYLVTGQVVAPGGLLRLLLAGPCSSQLLRVKAVTAWRKLRRTVRRWTFELFLTLNGSAEPMQVSRVIQVWRSVQRRRRAVGDYVWCVARREVLRGLACGACINTQAQPK